MLDKSQIIDLLKEHNITDTAALLKVDYFSLYYFIRKHNIPRPGRSGNGKSKARIELNKRSRESSISKEDIEELYVKQELPMKMVGSLLGVAASVICRSMKKYGIPARLSNGKYEHRKPKYPRELLEDLYINQGLSYKDISKKLPEYLHSGDVQQDIRYYGIKGRSYKEAGKNMYKKNPALAYICTKHWFERGVGNYSIDTSIERLFEQWLISLDIKYTKQFPVYRFTHRFDFYIDSTNILVELDGDYWHSLPENIERDMNNDFLAIEEGFEVVRIKQSEIKEHGDSIFMNKVGGHLWQ